MVSNTIPQVGEWETCTSCTERLKRSKILAYMKMVTSLKF